MSDQPGPGFLQMTIPVPGGSMRITLTSQFEPASSLPATEPTQTAPTSAGETEKATEAQIRKAYAEMHRIGDDLAKAYLQGHFATIDVRTLHKRTISQFIKWCTTQDPAKKG